MTFRALANPGPLVDRLFHEMLWLRIERGKDCFPKRIKGQRIALCRSQRLDECRPKLDHLNKIVRMPRLQ